MGRLFTSAILTLGLSVAVQAQGPGLASRFDNDFRVVPNITYVTASNREAKLDVYARRSAPDNQAAPQPTLIFIHGGGWIAGTKEERALALLPYLAMGMNVVNIDYRLADVALAPAAVEDCRCALRWVLAHAREYGFDPGRIAVAGESAGGHLALMTGFLPASAGLDRQCPGSEDLRVAAVINWYGVSNVNELLDGANMRPYAVTWVGSRTDRDEVARRVSPLTYVRPGLPAVLTIHGDADPTVPYTQSVRLHQALTDAQVPNELMTIPGGKHFYDCCTTEQRTRAYDRIASFLRERGVLPAAMPTSSGR